MTYIFIARRCADLPVAAWARVMKVSTSAFYAGQAHPVSDRDLDDAILTNDIFDIHKLSRAAYGSPRESTPSSASATANGVVAASG
jgi:hypothetical protein